MPPTLEQNRAKINQELSNISALNPTLGNNLKNLVNPTTPISSNNLTDTGSLNLPTTPVPTNNQPAIDANLKSLQDIQAQITASSQQERLQGDLASQIAQSIQNLGGKSARQQELEEQAGLPQQQKDLQNVVNQLTTLSNEANAIPLQIQQQFEGTGATAGGVQPIQTADLRRNAIKSLQLSSIGQALSGNLALAQQNVERAVNAEFEVEQTKLDTLKFLYESNKDELNRQDKKRADLLAITIQERSRILTEQRADKESIYGMMNTLASYGVPSDIVQEVGNAKSIQDALVKATPYMQNPQVKLEMQGAVLNNELRRLQIREQSIKNRYLETYGGLSPAEYSKKLKEEQQLIEESGNEKERIKLEVEGLEEKVSGIDVILDHKGMSAVVGPNILSRGTFRQKGNLPSILRAGAFGIISPSEITGSADSFVALTEQFISQEFLDTLISAKAEGATFGALTRPEQDALTASATAIGQTKICDGKGGRCTEGAKVIGYDMPEEEFKRQMQIIKDTTQKVETRLRGKTIPNEARNILDTVYNNELLTPQQWYGNR